MALLSRSVRSLIGLLLAALLVLPASAQNLQLAEQDIKAGLLYNFLRYTQWPQSAHPDQAAIVCVYGADPFGGRLAPLAGRTVNQRNIQIRSVRSYADVDACSLLVVSSDERANWPQLRAHLAQRNVLTVSDYDGFAVSGGMIEFTRTNNRIGVLINVAAVQAANLSVQDRLLHLATTVRTASP